MFSVITKYHKGRHSLFLYNSEIFYAFTQDILRSPITALNDSLIDFKGAIVFTSHDHEFIQTIADHIVEVSAKGVVDRGDTTYDEYLAHEATQGRVQDLY